jgi:hypothetical protein
MSKLECWTRYNKQGNKYIVCNGSKGQKKSNVNYMKGRNRTIQDLMRVNEDLDYDILPMDVSRGSTQRRVETEDRRQQFLQKDRRNRFLEMTNQNEATDRRKQFSRTLSNPTEFMGKTFTPPQIPINPRYIKRMEKTKKQIAEKNYKSKQAEYRAGRQMRSLTEYFDLDARSKKAKSQKEYDDLRLQMEQGDFMKWERYNTAKNKKAQAKRKNKKN